MPKIITIDLTDEKYGIREKSTFNIPISLLVPGSRTREVVLIPTTFAA